MYDEQLLKRIDSIYAKLTLLENDIKSLEKENTKLRNLLQEVYAFRLREKYGQEPAK